MVARCAKCRDDYRAAVVPRTVSPGPGSHNGTTFAPFRRGPRGQQLRQGCAAEADAPNPGPVRPAGPGQRTGPAAADGAGSACRGVRRAWSAGAVLARPPVPRHPVCHLVAKGDQIQVQAARPPHPQSAPPARLGLDPVQRVQDRFGPRMTPRDEAGIDEIRSTAGRKGGTAIQPTRPPCSQSALTAAPAPIRRSGADVPKGDSEFDPTAISRISPLFEATRACRMLHFPYNICRRTGPIQATHHNHPGRLFWKECECFIVTSGLALFIDGSNLYAAAKALGFDIDYKLLRQEFMRRGKLLRAFLLHGPAGE